MTEVNEFMEYQSNVSFTPGVVAYQKDYVSSILDDMTELVSGKFDDWPDTISDYVYSYYTRLVSSTNDDTTTALLNQSMLIPDDFSVYSNLALCTELIGELSNPLVLTESGVFATDWRYFAFFNTYTDTSLLSKVVSAFTALTYSHDMNHYNCLSLNSLYTHLPWSQECGSSIWIYFNSLTYERTILLPETTVTPPADYNITGTLSVSGESVVTITTIYPFRATYEVPVEFYKSPTTTTETTVNTEEGTFTHAYTNGEAMLITQSFISEYTGGLVSDTTLNHTSETLALTRYETTGAIASSLEPLWQVQ
ncbi:unnamed protein product [Ambrosiozyma monospora]|uniref:Unnamed protein product n=1 Tax=Ambrosiozyma monospora TaxID=43982 RepID=A0ACB5UDP3_AMBMO|nr:unnamed protein product [Ambrosiozyma monospora]